MATSKNKFITAMAGAGCHFLQGEATVAEEPKHFLRASHFEWPAANPIDEVVPGMHPPRLPLTHPIQNRYEGVPQSQQTYETSRQSRTRSFRKCCRSDRRDQYGSQNSWKFLIELFYT